MKIAVYAIAKNEAKHVQRWLSATQGADLRVVADTGSVDGTQQLLAQGGAIVHQISVRPWRFDVARNSALALVPADVDVCLILDMDEVPDPDLFDKIRREWMPGVTRRGWITMDTGNHWQADRLHAREGYRWINPAHEVAVPYHGQSENPITISSRIHHLQDLTKDRTGYLQLLELSVREAPADARMWTYLTREHWYRQDWGQVIESAEQTLRREGWAPERAAVCRWAALAAKQLNQDPRDWLRRGVSECVSEAEPWHALWLELYESQDWEEIALGAARVNGMIETSHYLHDPAAIPALYDYAALAHHFLGHHELAIEFGERAVELNPGNQRIEDNLGFYRQAQAADAGPASLDCTG